MEALKFNEFGVQELNSKEIVEIDGGVIDPISIAIGAVGLALAAVAFGYSIGKDLAEADRRN